MLTNSTPIKFAAFDQKGEKVAAISADGTLKLFDAISGRELWMSANSKGQELYFNAQSLTAVGPEGVRKTIRIGDGHVLSSSNVVTYTTPPLGSISRDGKRLVHTSDSFAAAISDVASHRFIADLPGHLGGGYGVAFSPSGKRVATFGGDDMSAKIWDVSWITTYAAKLRDRVCAEKLIGAQEFVSELNDAVLGNIDGENPVARNPCMRRGPLHWEYYTQALDRLWGRFTSPEGAARVPGGQR